MKKDMKIHDVVVALSPHSDDVELGCGGFLAKQVERGNDVHVVVMLVKDEYQVHQKNIVEGVTRREELHQSMNVLGVSSWQILLNEKLDFDLCLFPKPKAVGMIDEIVRNTGATTVLLPVPSFHQEHQYVFDVGMAVTRPTKFGTTVTKVLAYEYPAANWGASAGYDASRGGYYVDTTQYHLKKLNALECHKSQMYREENAILSLDGVEALARLRGLEIGVKYAELLYVLRMIDV